MIVLDAPVAPLILPIWIDLTAIVVGALAGAALAVKERFDVMGVLFLAVLMGLGGGIIRDLLLGLRPVAVSDEAYLPTVAAAALFGFFFARVLRHLGSVLVPLDAFALAMFTIVGVEKTLLQGLGSAAAIFIGVAAATGGGVLRDIMSNRPVEVLRRGTWNAAAAMCGAGLYTLLRFVDAWDLLCQLATFVLIVTIRLLSVYRGWETPVPVDLTRRLPGRAPRI